LSNPALKECIRKLKFGDYQITDNIEVWYGIFLDNFFISSRYDLRC
jgi:hypothetical protein